MNKIENSMNTSERSKDCSISSMPGYAYFFPIINKNLNTSENNLFWLCIYSILYSHLKKKENNKFLELVANIKISNSVFIVEETDDFSTLILNLTAQDLLRILIDKDSKVRDLISNNIATAKMSDVPYNDYSKIINKTATTLGIQINLINVASNKTDTYVPEGKIPITDTIKLITNNANVGMAITTEDYHQLYPIKTTTVQAQSQFKVQLSTITNCKNIDNLSSNNESKVEKLKNPNNIQTCNNACGTHNKPMAFYCPECKAYRCEDCYDMHSVITPGTIAAWNEMPVSPISNLIADPKLVDEALLKLEEAYNSIKSKIETQLLQSMRSMDTIFKEEKSEEEWSDQMAGLGINEQHLLLIDRINCPEISDEKKSFEIEIEKQRKRINAAVDMFNVKINKRNEVEPLIEKELSLNKMN
jgi:hypothetical protein